MLNFIPKEKALLGYKLGSQRILHKGEVILPLRRLHEDWKISDVSLTKREEGTGLHKRIMLSGTKYYFEGEPELKYPVWEGEGILGDILGLQTGIASLCALFPISFPQKLTASQVSRFFAHRSLRQKDYSLGKINSLGAWSSLAPVVAFRGYSTLRRQPLLASNGFPPPAQSSHHRSNFFIISNETIVTTFMNSGGLPLCGVAAAALLPSQRPLRSGS